jgi:beta-galactosidase
MNKQRLSIKEGQFYLDGQATLLMAGEIHYFRLPKSLWALHLERLKESGCQVVSTYVPWLIHEPTEGTFEFEGETLEQYDLKAFIDLCKSYGFIVFLRPGPFVMAELHGEGVASYIHDKPFLKPLTWDKKIVPNGQIDVLHPYFLSRVEAYFEALFKFLKPYLEAQGGPVSLIQLDNEVGMLAWVSQSPPLTDDIIQDLGSDFNRKTYQFYEGTFARGHQKLGYLLRKRYSKYIEFLHKIVQNHAENMITLVNIHGTSGGRGLTFPIGFSQLVETFKDHIIGTDIYYENLDIRKSHDYYLINSMLNALKNPSTPATCLEFNAGNSNFGDNLSGIDTTDSMDKKIRLLFIQGHKLINFYLFSGGMNPLTHSSYETSNRRIAITGERHGFSAPVKLNGETTPMFKQMQQTLSILNVYGKEIAFQEEVTSNLTIGLILDYYMTDSMRHGTEIEALKTDLTMHREGAFVETFLKQALLLHIPMQSIHLELDHCDPKKHPILVLNTASYMASAIQQKLIDYLKAGGKLFLLGALPIKNLKGEIDQSLIDYLEIEPLEFLSSQTHPGLMLKSDQPIEGYHSFNASFAQRMRHNHESAYHDLDNHKVSYISDQVVWLTHHYPGYLYITKRWLDHLGVKPPLKTKTSGFIYVFKTESKHGALLHLLNFESHDVTVFFEDFIFDQITVKAYDSIMVPIHYHIHGATITSTCELIDVSNDHFTFETNGLSQIVMIDTNHSFENMDYIKTDQGYLFHLKASIHPVILK